MSEIKESPTVEVKRGLKELLLTNKVLEQLNPRQIESKEGIKYTIYTFQSKKGKPVEVLFFSPNELPLVQDEVEGKYVIINGDEPRWRTNEEWEDFSLKILRASANAESAQQSYAQQVKEAIASGKGMLLVEAGPEALLETTGQLGVKLDSLLREALSELRKKRLIDVGLEIVDSVLAANLIDDEGKFRQENQHEGEALYLLSLAGDNEAQQLLAKKREVIQESDRKREAERKAKFAEQRREGEKSSQEALELKELVAVHATRYLPKKGAENLEMPTTFKASDWQIPKDTIHFALNHEVAQHMYGSWENVPYVVISSLEDMIEVNGNPTVLNTVDTFWEIGPGRRLKLPKNTAIVQPGDLTKGEIIAGVETDNIRYKASGLVPEDIIILSEELSEEARDRLNSDVVEIIVDSFSEYPYGDQIELPREKMESLVEVTGFHENRLNILTDLHERSIEDVVASILNVTKIEATDEQKEIIVKKLKGRIVATIKRVAVEKKIIQMGYEVQPGGMWAWGGSWIVTSQTITLGAKLEVPVMAHTNHVSSKVEDAAIRGLGALLDVERTPEAKERMRAFNSSREYIRDEFVPRVTQDTKRMLYLTGVI